MKKFLGFVRKEFLHIFRDVRTLIILFGIPAAQILIFGYAVTTEVKNAGIGILDHAKDEYSRQITQKLISSDFFYLEENLDTEARLEEVFRKGDIKLVVVFPQGFSHDIYQSEPAPLSLIADGSEPNTARLVTNYATAIIQDFFLEKQVPGNSVSMTIQPEVRMLYNPGMESYYMFVPGVITLILILISAMMTSVTITREKEFGNMEVLLVSPLRPLEIILGKVTPYLALSFVNVIFILLLAFFVFGLPIEGSLILLLAESILYILLALSLGILISTISKTMQQAIFISLVGLLLPSLLLSGFIFPIENMPLFYQYLSLILPPKYFIIILKSIMIKGTGLACIWKETLVLIAMTVVFIGISVRKFKIRLE